MYSVIIESPAERFLKKLDKQEQIRVLKSIEELKNKPRQGKPLTGQLAGIWSLRTGKYRILYHIEDQKLIVLILKI